MFFWLLQFDWFLLLFCCICHGWFILPLRFFFSVTIAIINLGFWDCISCRLLVLIYNISVICLKIFSASCLVSISPYQLGFPPRAISDHTNCELYIFFFLIQRTKFLTGTSFYFKIWPDRLLGKQLHNFQMPSAEQRTWQSLCSQICRKWACSRQVF